MKFEFRIRFETQPKKKGLRRLAGSFLTNEEAPPPQSAPTPQFPAEIPDIPNVAFELPGQPQPQAKSLRLRAGLSVREVAKLLTDERIRKVVGDAEVGFYLKYASNNYLIDELARLVGTTDGVGVAIYTEKIENVIIREALGLGLVKKVKPVKHDGEDAAQRSRDEDREAQGRVERREHFEGGEDNFGECLHDNYGDESSS